MSTPAPHTSAASADTKAPTTAPTTAATTAVVAQLALAAELIVAYALLAGAPNPGMAAAAVVPLGAAALLRRRRRSGAVLALLAVAVTVGLRLVGLPFDLVRPGVPAPFLLSALQVLTIGVAVTSAVALLLPRSAQSADPGLRQVLVPGAALGAVLTAGLLVAAPQGDDTGDLTAAQVDAALTVQMVNYRFEPAQLRGQAGEPVALRFTNPSDDDHTFTIADLDLEVVVPSGRSRVISVEAPPGEYRVTCTQGSHLEDGMEGRLVITDGTGSTGAATAPAATAHHHHG